MKTSAPASAVAERPAAVKPLDPAEHERLLAQLQSAYPTATERLLVTALEECRKESISPNDPEKLIRCVIERITS